MKIKICGLKNQENIRSLSKLELDMMGFIFYAKSLRFVGEEFDNSFLQSLPRSIEKVGVFVDEKIEIVLDKIHKFGLNKVQLHGNEPVEYCNELKTGNIHVIKTFNVDEEFDFGKLKNYQKGCNYFLFDTKGRMQGGNGFAFDWQILNKYELDTPFILSGGIGFENIEHALNLFHPQLKGFDINSKIERAPGLKSIDQAEKMINKIRSYEAH
jgi:phosphoribosylanthranilate isomerase